MCWKHTSAGDEDAFLAKLKQLQEGIGRQRADAPAEGCQGDTPENPEQYTQMLTDGAKHLAEEYYDATHETMHIMNIKHNELI